MTELSPEVLTEIFFEDLEEARLSGTDVLKQLRRQGYVVSKFALSVAIEESDNQQFAWIEKAACRGMDIADFNPVNGGMTVEAEMTCDECPVRQRCLSIGLRHIELPGIMGGMSERERRGLPGAGLSASLFEIEKNIFVDLRPGYNLSLTHPSVAQEFSGYLEGRQDSGVQNQAA